MLPWLRPLTGRLDELAITSSALADNPLGDPVDRPLWVYTPPGYDDEPKRRYPSVYVIQGFTGSLDMWRARTPWRLTYPEAVDELFAAAAAPACLVVFVDCWTALGGSQFLDSPAIGRYSTYLHEEVVPYVDQRYRTLAEPAHRGIQGKSSGGYGAMVSAMRRPDVWGGLATHAGDALFEACYLPEFPVAARALRDDYAGSYAEFWTSFRTRPPMSRDSDPVLLNEWAMASAYSADPDGTVQLPFDVATGQLVPQVWERWLEHDPVRMVARHADALHGLRAIWVDAGTRDQYYLDLGATAFRRELERIGVTDISFELFDATHMRIEYRYPLALRYLADRLQ